MAYDNTKLNLLFSPMTNSAGGQVWQYTQGTDVAGTIDAAGYFSDGVARGMKVNDIVICIDTATAATPLVTTHVVQSLTATAANVSLGTTIGSTTTGD
jgi:hypothetical protein